MSENAKQPAAPVTWTEISEPQALPAEPLVSVHMITYNHGPYIAEAIEGVIAQETDFPIELVIGEDCSTDNTRTIAQEYQRKYPHLIRLLLPNRNVGSAANYEKVARACKGRYVAFCEGDDYWHRTDKLALQVAYMADRPEYGAVHSDVDIIVLWCKHWWVRHSIKRSSGCPVPEGDIYKVLQMGMFIHACSVLVRGSSLMDFFASRFRWQSYHVLDWPLMAFISHNAKVGFLADSLAVYRVHEGSAMRAGAEAAIKRVLNARGIYEDFVAEYGSIDTDEWSWRGNIAEHLYEAAYDARDMSTFEEAVGLLTLDCSRRYSRLRVMADRVSIRNPVIHATRRFVRGLRGSLAVVRHYDLLEE